MGGGEMDEKEGRWADPSAGRLQRAPHPEAVNEAAVFRLTARDLALAGLLCDVGPATATQAAAWLGPGPSESSFRRARARVRTLTHWGWLTEVRWCTGEGRSGSPLVGPGPMAAKRTLAPRWRWEPELVCRTVPTHQLLLRVRHVQRGWWPMKPGGGPLAGYLLVHDRQVTVAVIRSGCSEPERLRVALTERTPKGPLWVVAATPQELPAAAQACAAAGLLKRSAFTTDANLWHEGTPIADAWWIAQDGTTLQPARLTALVNGDVVGAEVSGRV